MAAAITFLGVNSGTFTSLATSGVGFFGSSGFGTSVQVGSYQDTTFITNSNGSVNGGQLNNNKYVGNVSGVQVNGAATSHVSGLVPGSGVLNVRFTFDDPVQTQNGELRIFDRSDINNGAVGVTTQVNQIVNGGSGVDPATGDAQSWDSGEDGWIAPSGSGVTVTLLNSPGSGGLSPSGASTQDTRHDWYFGLSASPISIGSKTQFGLYVELEYL